VLHIIRNTKTLAKISLNRRRLRFTRSLLPLDMASPEAPLCYVGVSRKSAAFRLMKQMVLFLLLQISSFSLLFNWFSYCFYEKMSSFDKFRLFTIFFVVQFCWRNRFCFLRFVFQLRFKLNLNTWFYAVFDIIRSCACYNFVYFMPTDWILITSICHFEVFEFVWELVEWQTVELGKF